MEHLVVGLECFDLDLLDYNPIDVEHKKHGRGVTFSQVSGGGKNNKAHYHVIVSERGLILPSGGSCPIATNNSQLWLCCFYFRRL